MSTSLPIIKHFKIVQEEVAPDVGTTRLSAFCFEATPFNFGTLSEFLS